MADEENRNVSQVSADAVHKEGTEHIKEQVEERQERQQGEGTANPAPVHLPKPPASNPGANDPSAGIAKDAGGLSCTAHVESPVPAQDTGKSIVGTIKGFLGLEDNKPKDAADTPPARNAGTTTAAVSGVAATVGAAQIAELADRTRTSSSVPQEAAPSSSLPMEESRLQQADTGASAAGSSSSSRAETKDESNTNKKMSDDNNNNNDSNESGETKKKSGGKLENEDSIPTAGGKRLGEEHWGESKIVPDNPKPQGEGVASADGQPDSATASNTAANTGGASGGPGHDDGSKPSVVEKIKDKLPFGSKNKE